MSRFYDDSPTTVAEMVGMKRLSAAAAEQSEREDAARLRAQLIARGQIRPTSKAEATRAMLVAKGIIQPADPGAAERARRPRLANVTLKGGFDAMLAAGER